MPWAEALRRDLDSQSSRVARVALQEARSSDLPCLIATAQNALVATGRFTQECTAAEQAASNLRVPHVFLPGGDGIPLIGFKIAHDAYLGRFAALGAEVWARYRRCEPLCDFVTDLRLTHLAGLRIVLLATAQKLLMSNGDEADKMQNGQDPTTYVGSVLIKLASAYCELAERATMPGCFRLPLAPKRGEGPLIMNDVTRMEQELLFALTLDQLTVNQPA